MTADPIDAMRHAISYAHRRHKDKAAGLYQPLKSDLEVGIDFLMAAARYRLHKQIDDHGDAVLHQMHWQIDAAMSDMGLLHVGR